MGSTRSMSSIAEITMSGGKAAATCRWRRDGDADEITGQRIHLYVRGTLLHGPRGLQLRPGLAHPFI
jgi:hypothetical protein